MSEKKPSKYVRNYMAKVLCSGIPTWANSCQFGLRCTKCGSQSHDKTKT